MNSQKFVATMAGILLAFSVAAQEVPPQTRIIRANGFSIKKTWCQSLKRGRPTGNSYLMVVDSLNNRGFSFQQITFKEDGSVSKQTSFSYKGDSLNTNITTSDNTGKVSFMSTYGYDSIGRMNYMKFFDKPSGRLNEFYMEFDDEMHIRSSFEMVEGKKVLKDIHYFDDQKRILKDFYYDRNGGISTGFIYEYDTAKHTVKKFSTRNGNKEFQSKKTYSSNNVLVSDEVVYTNNVTLRNTVGKTTAFEKGDAGIVEYVYDGKGLLTGQTEKLNGRIILQLTFEYL